MLNVIFLHKKMNNDDSSISFICKTMNVYKYLLFMHLVRIFYVFFFVNLLKMLWKLKLLTLYWTATTPTTLNQIFSNKNLNRFKGLKVKNNKNILVSSHFHQNFHKNNIFFLVLCPAVGLECSRKPKKYKKGNLKFSAQGFLW